jgi:hypothetical protein
VTIRKAAGDVYAATIDDKIAMKIGEGARRVSRAFFGKGMCACVRVYGLGVVGQESTTPL